MIKTETLALPVIHSEEVRLVGFGTIEDLSIQIASRLYGELLKLAMPVVKEYHSDLYHDAWVLREKIERDHQTEPFVYLVRPSGTHLDHTAECAMSPSLWQRGSKAYIVTLIESDRGEWSARFDLIKQ